MKQLKRTREFDCTDTNYPRVWIGLKYNYTTQTFKWDDGTDLTSCDPIRFSEPFDATNMSASGNGRDCFAAYYDANYSQWRISQEYCSSIASISICQGERRAEN